MTASGAILHLSTMRNKSRPGCYQPSVTAGPKWQKQETRRQAGRLCRVERVVYRKPSSANVSGSCDFCEHLHRVPHCGQRNAELRWKVFRTLAGTTGFWSLPTALSPSSICKTGTARPRSATWNTPAALAFSARCRRTASGDGVKIPGRWPFDCAVSPATDFPSVSASSLSRFISSSGHGTCLLEQLRQLLALLLGGTLTGDAVLVCPLVRICVPRGEYLVMVAGDFGHRDRRSPAHAPTTLADLIWSFHLIARFVASPGQRSLCLHPCLAQPDGIRTPGGDFGVSFLKNQAR